MKVTLPTVLLVMLGVFMLCVLPGAAYMAGRSSVHCPDTTVELERADGELRKLMLTVDSAHAETARWHARYDSLRNAPAKTIKQRINETRDHLRGAGFDALVDSLGARPES